mmetsp:Transcript_41502/g.90368  ORF Transcript_41502/g.90368 Transcript_41502/m.90368 type:complete len:681 (-) Transcript_41502:131-2173(-)
MSDPSAVRAEAWASAEVVLKNEISRMLPAPLLSDLEAAYNGEGDLWTRVASDLIDLTTSAPNGYKCVLVGVDEGTLKAKLQLFWRCFVAVAMLPPARRQALGKITPCEDPLEKVEGLRAEIKRALPTFAQCWQPIRAEPRVPVTVATPPPVQPAAEKLQKQTLPEEDENEEVEIEDIAPVAKLGTKPAAKHTYDTYQKWDKIDYDAEERAVDYPTTVKIDVASLKAKEQPDFPADPMEALELLEKQVKASEAAGKKGQADAGDGAGAEGRMADNAAGTEARQGDGGKTDGPEVDAGEASPACVTEQAATSDAADEGMPCASDAAGAPDPPASRAPTAATPSGTNQPPATEDPDALHVGADVFVHSLRSERGRFLNGCRGKIRSGPLNGRWGVVLDGEKGPKSIQADNLRLAPPVVPRPSEVGTSCPQRRWDDIEDEPELDALTGPPEEVARIRRNWSQADQARRSQGRRAPAPPAPIPAAGPVQPRPDVVQPVTSHFEAAYKKWDKLDTTAMELELDNEDRKPAEDADMMLRSDGGAVSMTAVNYKQDREEYEMDEELQARTKDMQAVVRAKMTRAWQNKESGDALSKKGEQGEALRNFLLGAQELEYCITARCIMAPGLSDKVRDVGVAVKLGAARAAAATADWDVAKSMSEQVLELDNGCQEAKEINKAAAKNLQQAG